MVQLKIKESIFIRVNNPTLNRNIGKFYLPHIWDKVLLHTPGLTLKRHAQAIGHANYNTSLLTQPNLPTHLGQHNSPTQFFTGSEHTHRTSQNPYKLQFFSSPSDLMKSTVVDESLSTTMTRVLFQRESTYYFMTIQFLNFERRYEKLSDFTLQQAFSLTPLSDKELDKLAPKIKNFSRFLCSALIRYIKNR